MDADDKQAVQDYSEMIDIALQAVGAVHDLDLRAIAFRTVLEDLIDDYELGDDDEEQEEESKSLAPAFMWSALCGLGIWAVVLAWQWLFT